MKSFLLTAIATVAFASGAQAQAPVTDQLDFTNGLFLAAPAVSDLLKEASKDGLTVYVDHVVSTRGASTTSSTGHIISTTAVCVQLGWFGGDTFAPLGVIRGAIESENMGRGLNLTVKAVSLDVNYGGIAPTCG